MKRASIISHGLAVAVGLLAAAAVLPRPGAGGNTTAVTGPELAAKSMVRGEGGKAPGPREMLEELSHMPMDAFQRNNLKRDLWTEWAKADPEGLLRHLQDRAWPGGGGLFFYGPEHAFEELARRNPQALIDYARREGCKNAWASLCDDGDPRTILPLLLGKGDDEPLPAWIFGTLFRRGLGVDSSFQNEFSRLKDPARRQAAFSAVSEELLDRRRLDDYFRFIGESEMDAAVIGREFGTYAGKNAEVLGEIEGLPEAARPLAVAGVVNGLQEHTQAEDTRGVIGTLNDEGWWGWAASDPNWREKLGSLTSDVAWGPEDGDLWCDWALKLADGGEVGSFLKEAALRSWACSAESEWQPRLAAITDPALHDRTAALLAGSLTEEEGAGEALALIGDEDLRKRTAQELKDWEDPDSTIDPFAPKPKWWSDSKSADNPSAEK